MVPRFLQAARSDDVAKVPPPTSLKKRRLFILLSILFLRLMLYCNILIFMYLTECINALVKYVDVPRVLQHI